MATVEISHSAISHLAIFCWAWLLRAVAAALEGLRRADRRLGAARHRVAHLRRCRRLAAREPRARSLDIDVVHRCDVERQQLRHEQAADDGEAERAARLSARSHPKSN